MCRSEFCFGEKTSSGSAHGGGIPEKETKNKHERVTLLLCTCLQPTPENHVEESVMKSVFFFLQKNNTFKTALNIRGIKRTAVRM